MNEIIKINLKTMLVIFTAILFLSSVFMNATANEHMKEVSTIDGTVSITMPMGTYTIKKTDNGDKISVTNYGRLLIPGKPNVPSKIFAVAIPPNAEVKEVTFDTGEAVMLPGTYSISPSPLPRVIGTEDPVIYEREKKIYEKNYESVYGNDDPYPQSVGEFVRTAGYREYNLVDVRISPFIYYPQSGEILYYPKITVNVAYTFPDGFSPDTIVSERSKNAEEIAEHIIVNYEQTEKWYTKQTRGKSTNDYVIITIETLNSSISELVDWEEKKGRNVKVVTTSWIDTNYDGWDLAEKMRNFLIEKYPSDEWNILYVCLIGDYDDVPMRRTAQDLGYGTPETDYYYAELSKPDDESWDADQDHQYGESTDPIDFYNEIAVGRIPWSDPDIIEHICEKSIAYEQNSDPSFKENILLIGTFFWPNTDNAVLMEAKTDPVEHPWMENWSMTRMYEEDQSNYECDYDVSYNTVTDVWSKGTYAFVDWAGHGSPTACYEYYPSQKFVDTITCTSLNDDYPAIIFADACSNSDTDHDNIGKMMLKQGGVGFLGATKVALGCPGWSDPMDGSSQSLDYFFTTCCTSGNYTQGQAHQYALIEMYTNNLWGYNYYETFEWGALWGNPDLGMVTKYYNKPPETPSQPDGPAEGVEDREYTFSSTTTDPEGEQIYYQFSWGDGNVSEWIGPYDSGTTVEASHTWIHPGEYRVKAKAKDINGTESDWSDSLQITIVKGPVLDTGLISGGLLGVNSNIKNTGATEAIDIKWSITLTGGTIFMGKESSGEISTLLPGESQSITSDLILGFGNTQVTITAEIAEGTDTRTQEGLVLLFFIYVTPSG
jgi:hypothetical protein